MKTETKNKLKLKATKLKNVLAHKNADYVVIAAVAGAAYLLMTKLMPKSDIKIADSSETDPYNYFVVYCRSENQDEFLGKIEEAFNEIETKHQESLAQ